MKKVILIEDNREIGTLIKILLEERGFEVVWLKTFDTALEFLNALEIDESLVAVIFDYGLNEINTSITSVPLVKILKEKGYTGLSIANSLNNKGNENLEKAGCSHIRPGLDKFGVVQYIAEQKFE